MGLVEVLPSVCLLLEAFMRSELAKNMRTALPIPVCRYVLSGKAGQYLLKFVHVHWQHKTTTSQSSILGGDSCYSKLRLCNFVFWIPQK